MLLMTAQLAIASVSEVRGTTSAFAPETPLLVALPPLIVTVTLLVLPEKFLLQQA